MDTENKNEIKNNVISGVAAVGGAVAGAVSAMFVSFDATAETVEPRSHDEKGGPGVIHPIEEHSDSLNSSHQSDELLPIETLEDPNPTLTVEPANVDPSSNLVDEIIPGYPGGEVEIIDYQRVIGEDGNPFDKADVIVAGDQISIVDLDLDGYADLMIHDENIDSILDESEVHSIGYAKVSMEPFQSAAGFDPLLAQFNSVESDSYDLDSFDQLSIHDDNYNAYMAQDHMDSTGLPDYVNDADVDCFMA